MLTSLLIAAFIVGAFAASRIVNSDAVQGWARGVVAEAR